MKRTEKNNRRTHHWNQQSQKTQKDLKHEKSLHTSFSAECLLTKEVKQRKASTPTHDRTALSNSPDISHITMGEVKSTQPSVKRAGKTISLGKPKTVASSAKTKKEIDLQELDFNHTLNLQTLFENELLKSRCAKIDSEIQNIQQEITEKEKILKKTTQRLKNISFNKEIDALYQLHNPNYGQILETLDNTNCEEYMSKLNTKLEQTQNQLKVKTIEIPSGGGAELLETVSETLSAFEKLKTDHDVETPMILKEIKAINKSTIDSLTRGKDNLAVCEDHLLNRAVLEISTRKDL